MVSYRNWKGFYDNFDFQVNYMLYWQFHFENDDPINVLFTQWKWTYILDFGPRRGSALNMGCVGKCPSGMQEQWVFRSRAGRTKVFSWVHKILISLWGTPLPISIYLPKKARREEFQRPPILELGAWGISPLKTKHQQLQLLCTVPYFIFVVYTKYDV